MNNVPKVSETSLARAIFGPLGGIVEIGAVADSGEYTNLNHVSIENFTTRNHENLHRILHITQMIGKFHASTMALVDELGWHANHEVTAPSLLLWSGGIEKYSPNIETPQAVHRMLSTGGDLQLVEFMHALIGAAVARSQPAESTSELIIQAVRGACTVVGISESGADRTTYRMWRVAHLPTVLMPNSGSPEAVKTGYRSFAHAIGRLVS
ncbi:hypothetical protein OG379_07075 [Streptomyces sp. NBC_01166]|uniref:hypothetical protein n=1 Tax=Streptomyces sp. NBC_01166 TaxID=2903755 RepID=UPI00386D72C9|nr:hypothetical protein OG379_07075 [Streptomyces sp. NBC_01166]